jgi:membrane protease subunit HflK
VGEGLHYRLPFPIERVDIVNVSQVRREGIGLRPPEHAVALHPPEETQVLTGDENIVSIKIIVQYKIKDPADYLLRVDSDANPLIRSAVKSALISLGGRAGVDDLLTTGRPDLQRAMLANAQKVLDNYASGLQLISINLQEVVPPTQVADAFRNVSSAREEKQATINDAQGYANSVLPKARGDAERLNREAQGYVAQVTSRAQGDAQRFSDVFKEYWQSAANRATDVTRYRYFVETMEQILVKVKKYIVDPREQNIRIVQ